MNFPAVWNPLERRVRRLGGETRGTEHVAQMVDGQVGTPGANMTEREAFEATARSESGFNLSKDGFDDYDSDDTERAWCMWQAARTQRPSPQWVARVMSAVEDYRFASTTYVVDGPKMRSEIERLLRERT